MSILHKNIIKHIIFIRGRNAAFVEMVNTTYKKSEIKLSTMKCMSFSHCQAKTPGTNMLKS